MEGIVNIRGKQYKTVALRVSEFREKYPIETGWAIITEIIRADDLACVIHASVVNPDGVTVATGYAEENRSDSGVNYTSALENAETSAIGRALSAAGFGGSEYASADEIAAAINRDKAQPAKKQDKEKPWLNEGTDTWEKVVKAIERDGYTIADVEKKYRISNKVRTKLEQIEADAWQVAGGTKK